MAKIECAISVSNPSDKDRYIQTLNTLLADSTAKLEKAESDRNSAEAAFEAKCDLLETAEAELAELRESKLCLCPLHFGDCKLCEDGKCASPDL